MAGPEHPSEGMLTAAKSLYEANLETIRWIQQRTLTVTFQVVGLDLVVAAAAVNSSVRLATTGRIFAGVTLVALHMVVFVWLADQRQGQTRRAEQMREAHVILRSAIKAPDVEKSAPGRTSERTWFLLRSLLVVAGASAFFAALWPGLLTR